MIEVQDLGRRYGAVEAVRGVSFEISKGEVVGLLGPNGAGKTTIMKILTCYLYPSRGTARINGCDIFEAPLEIKKSVGYLPENAPLYTDLNVTEYLDFIAESRALKGSARKERVEWVIEECGLKDVLHKGIHQLSKGYRQRTGLAQAILHDPEILILDEPTSGLDPNQIIEIRELIRRHGRQKTVILSTHILQEVEATCGRVLILNEGQIVAQGTTEEIWREMKGEVRLGLTLKGGADPQPDLAGLTGVRRVTIAAAAGAGPAGAESAGSDPGMYRLQLALEPDAGVEEAVFDWAVRSGYKILAMVPRRLSLEDIFIQLTRENN